jgi:flagellar basal-body rod protein FlgF/flagellar basal-body rod protein FlgG
VDSGFYATCTGLRTQTQALELVANNLANLHTGGYRGQQATFRSLLAVARGAADPLNRAINDFNVLRGSQLDLSPGSMERTGGALDLAIEGNGFFAVQTAAGTLYTRNGNFQTSAKGQLITAQGDPVLGEQGPVTLPGGTVSVGPDGTLSANGGVFGKLRVVEFAPGTALEAAGASYYSAPTGTARPTAGATVRQGMLEASNVSPVAAVVNLIAVQRHAEMLGRALNLFHTEFNRIASGELPRV